ncbi:nucleoside hydrolase [Cryobacterium tepidiphilum]|uniref:Nucleoside hydrolase n=1 Tax=Cryobacterium tepidiphilum TaxID=2486026 RepID=A0A3M8LBS2_9MICO|nr:nucleoside hydrolase [Cryobacterium tepidiphilum]RNE62222.1 nucleoside hydrolase [Cryobacterium tepidiphilum]
MKPTIIDCDPGIDDAIAILLAFASPELDVRAITTVAGNTTVERTTANAHRLLHLIGRTDVPVGRGASQPLVRAAGAPIDDIHGTDGLGDAGIPPAPEPETQRDAIQLIIETVESSPEPVTLIAVGPLTNIALLHAVRPDIVDRLERIVIMGGAAKGGNVAPTAEYNIWFDPEAAQRVFGLDVDIVMVGLDVTQKAITRPIHWAELEKGGLASQQILAMNAFYSAYHASRGGEELTMQHDALAVAAAIRPDLVTVVPARVNVECASPLTVGTTVVDVANPREGGRVRVALDVEVEEFNEFLVSRIARFLSEVDARTGKFLAGVSAAS